MAGSGSTMRAARLEAGRVIPQALQEPIRERLRLLRMSRGRRLAEMDPEVSLISYGTLSSYELHDLSSMRLYHLYGLSRWLDINFLEFLAYLFDTEGNDTLLATRQTNTDRMIRLMGYLSEEDQKMALMQVDAIVESRGKVGKEVVTKDRARRGDGGVQGVQARSQGG